MKTKLSLFAFTTMMLGVLAMPGLLNASILIDSFTAGNTLSQFGAGGNSQTTISRTILGNERRDSINVRQQNGDEFFGILGFGGELSVGQGANDTVFGSVSYSNFRRFDLTQAGANDHFVLNFQANDLDIGLSDVLRLVVHSNGQVREIDVDIPASSSLPSAVQVGFDEFARIDFSEVDEIELAFDFAKFAGRDFVISSFGVAGGLGSDAAIPEPASAVFAIALGGLVAMRRRRS